MGGNVALVSRRSAVGGGGRLVDLANGELCRAMGENAPLMDTMGMMAFMRKSNRF